MMLEILDYKDEDTIKLAEAVHSKICSVMTNDKFVVRPVAPENIGKFYSEYLNRIGFFSKIVEDTYNKG